MKDDRPIAYGMTIDRDENTLFELKVRGPEEAARFFEKISAERKVAWLQCDSLEEYLMMSGVLLYQDPDYDIFLFIALPPSSLDWEKVELVGTGVLEDVLFRLWPDEKRLYFARTGGNSSITGGDFVPRNAELGL